MEEHSPHYQQVKDFYEGGFWDKNRVSKAVEKGWITEKECIEILHGKEVD